MSEALVILLGGSGLAVASAIFVRALAAAVPVLTEAVAKLLRARADVAQKAAATSAKLVDQLAVRMDSLEAENERLKARIAELEAMLRECEHRSERQHLDMLDLRAEIGGGLVTPGRLRKPTQPLPQRKDDTGRHQVASLTTSILAEGKATQ